MDRRLADREFLTGEYSIADMASIGWTRSYKRQGQDLDDFPNLKRWFETLMARPAVKKGCSIGIELRQNIADEKDAQKVLFGQKAQ